jgi:nucleoside-diphosphate-sugar epimerase
VSTAFVAGARRDPVVYEDELDPSQGFESPYEQSKYEAEVVVREWAAARSWSVVVFRPSILVTDRPPHPDMPAHTLGSVARWVVTIASMAAELGLGGDGEPAPSGSPVPTVRVVGDPQARFNLMPVEDAAREMARIADRSPPEGITTYHIVQGRDLPASLFIDLLEGFFPVHLELVSSRPADQSRLERMIDNVPGFTMYLGHRHAFDDTRTRTVLGERQAGTQVDREYLLSCFGAEDPAQSRPPVPSADPIDVPVHASPAAASRLPAPAPATDSPAIDRPARDRSRR